MARHTAFTLVEVLLTISLIIVITSLFVYNLPNLTQAFQQRTSEDLLRDALFQARAQAAREKTPVTLTWNTETQTLSLSAIEQTDTPDDTPDSLAQRLNRIEEAKAEPDPDEASEPTGKSWNLAESAGGETELAFYIRLSPEGLPSRYEDKYATEPTNHLRFEPTGAATPALVEIDNERGERRYALNPFNHDLTELDK